MVRSALVFTALAFIASTALAAGPQAAQPQASGPLDPNERICEKITVTGSRLATRTVCATRSEWQRRNLEERQIIERTQTSPCVETSMGAGKAACHT